MRNLIKFLKKNSFFIIFLFLEGIALILIVQHNSFQKSAVINSTRNITGFLFKNMQSYQEYFHLKKINTGILEENLRLRNKISVRLEENSNLTLQPLTQNQAMYKYHLAKVINNSVSKQYNYITVNAGRRHGIREDMAVISDNAVVGVITGVSENYSVVLPVLNRNFKISAKIARNNYFGVAEWDGLSRQSAVLREIPIHVEIFPGDTIVSSGYSAIFPEGIMIGVITNVEEGDGNYYEIQAKLISDFKNLYYVTIVENLFQEEQKNIENQAGI